MQEVKAHDVDKEECSRFSEVLFLKKQQFKTIDGTMTLPSVRNPPFCGLISRPPKPRPLPPTPPNPCHLPPTSAKQYLHRRTKDLHWRTKTNDGVILLSKTHKEVKSIFGPDLVLRIKIFKKKKPNSL